MAGAGSADGGGGGAGAGREQARLDAAYLRLLAEVEGREDVVPRVRGGSSRAAAFARASLGLDPRRAGRDADAARLTAGGDPGARGNGNDGVGGGGGGGGGVDLALWARRTRRVRSRGRIWMSRSGCTAASATACVSSHAGHGPGDR